MLKINLINAKIFCFQNKLRGKQTETTESQHRQPEKLDGPSTDQSGLFAVQRRRGRGRDLHAGLHNGAGPVVVRVPANRRRHLGGLRPGDGRLRPRVADSQEHAGRGRRESRLLFGAAVAALFAPVVQQLGGGVGAAGAGGGQGHPAGADQRANVAGQHIAGRPAVPNARRDRAHPYGADEGGTGGATGGGTGAARRRIATRVLPVSENPFRHLRTVGTAVHAVQTHRVHQVLLAHEHSDGALLQRARGVAQSQHNVHAGGRPTGRAAQIASSQ